MKSFIYKLRESTQDSVYESLKTMVSDWPKADYFKSDFLQNMQAKFGDRVAQYLDTIMISRKLPSESQFESKLDKILPSGKRDLLIKVLEFYASK